MDNYDLLSITINNEFLKNAIRWHSQGLVQAIRLSVRRPLAITRAFQRKVEKKFRLCKANYFFFLLLQMIIEMHGFLF
jgi:hypothetical protein